MLLVALATAGVPTAKVETTEFPPVSVHAFPGPGGRPRAGTGACGIQFQFFDAGRAAWVDYFLGYGAAAELRSGLEYAGEGEGAFMVPPHDGWFWQLDFDVLVGPPFLPANAYRSPSGTGPWRVVDESDIVIMSFDGPYAVDARALQERLGQGAAYDADRKAPGCHPTSEHECWTALDIWLQLEAWKDDHCPGQRIADDW